MMNFELKAERKQNCIEVEINHTEKRNKTAALQETRTMT